MCDGGLYDAQALCKHMSRCSEIVCINRTCDAQIQQGRGRGGGLFDSVVLVCR